MRTYLLASLMMACPLFVNASAVYTYSQQVYGGNIGFTYTAPDYLNGSLINVPANSFTSCDLAAMPGWGCTNANFQQYAGAAGKTNISVTLGMVYSADPNDAFSTDEVYDSFPDAALNQDGAYRGFLNGAVLTVNNLPDHLADVAAAPEPATWGLLGLSGLLLGLIRFVPRRNTSTQR